MSKKGIYAKYLSKEYKKAWNKIWQSSSGVTYFKDLESGEDEREIKSKL